MTFEALKTTTLATLDADLSHVFDGILLPGVLDEACRYAMASGGKRIRPLLVASAFFDVGGQSFDSQPMRQACLAVELLHGYSLIHDDLPCMDDDDLRRGRPTCHKVFGEDVALLAGDVLQSLAFEVLSMNLPNAHQSPLTLGNQSDLLGVFAPRARRMVAGQMKDILGEGQRLNQDELQSIHKDKTGALIEASVLMGAVAMGANKCLQDQLQQFAKLLGLAFQVQDDWLDVAGDLHTLGKPIGSDNKLDKSTYIKLLGVTATKAYADTLFERAKSVLEELGFGDGYLYQLTEQIEFRSR